MLLHMYNVYYLTIDMTTLTSLLHPARLLDHDQGIQLHLAIWDGLKYQVSNMNIFSAIQRNYIATHCLHYFWRVPTQLGV